VGDWQTNLARFSPAVDAGCRFASGRLHGNVPPCCRSIARYAVLGQAKNRSPVHLLAHFRTRPYEMFRLGFYFYADGLKTRATPLLHQRSPVGAGPSLNTCP
jgi:hypothetical protein